MLIHSKKDWEVPESAVTPEAAYRLHNRRDFLKTVGVGLTGAALGGRSALGAAQNAPTGPTVE
ncbi:MAG: twin-arginine translocation signal domain-containing protein, partial [Opitutaceae bacterium]